MVIHDIHFDSHILSTFINHTHMYIYISLIYIYIVFHVPRFPPSNIWQFLDIYLHPMCFFRCLGHFVYSDPWIAQEIPRIWMVYEDWKCFVLLKVDESKTFQNERKHTTVTSYSTSMQNM
jgi:hypothetical protein